MRALFLFVCVACGACLFAPVVASPVCGLVVASPVCGFRVGPL